MGQEARVTSGEWPEARIHELRETRLILPLPTRLPQMREKQMCKTGALGITQFDETFVPPLLVSTVNPPRGRPLKGQMFETETMIIILSVIRFELHKPGNWYENESQLQTVKRIFKLDHKQHPLEKELIGLNFSFCGPLPGSARAQSYIVWGVTDPGMG